MKAPSKVQKIFPQKKRYNLMSKPKKKKRLKQQATKMKIKAPIKIKTKRKNFLTKAIVNLIIRTKKEVITTTKKKMK